MTVINQNSIKELVRRAVFAHKKLKHDLIIKVVNPANISALQYIKDQRDENIVVDIEYDIVNLEQAFHEDIKKLHIGLVIVSKEMFANTKIRNTLYEAHVPVLKLSDISFASVKETVVILNDNRDLERVSSTIYDISAQMGFNIELHNYMSEHQEIREQVIEHYYSLSTIFSKSIKVVKDTENPIKALKSRESFIQILPFTHKFTARRIYSLFSTDSEKHYHKLDKYHQLFIPVPL